MREHLRRRQLLEAPIGVATPRSRRLSALYAPRVLFVYGADKPTVRYRAQNVREYLSTRDIELAIARDSDIPRRLQWMLRFDILVLVGIPMSPALRTLIDAAKGCYIQVLYDADDLIWEPAIADAMGEVADWPAEDKKRHIEEQVRYREALSACDLVVVPTDYLAAEVTNLGKRAMVLRNGVNRLQVEASAEAARLQPIRDFVTIGYFSGTPTHRVDFEQAAPALLRLLADVPTLRLVIGGYLEAPAEFRAFKERIIRLPPVRWERLPRNLALADINIAPLEVGNPFCEGKSELKYFEAGLLGIPTVASPTSTFRGIIADGQNGYLAANEQGWYSTLRGLVEDPDLRKRIGESARQHVLQTYTEEALGVAAFSILQEAARAERRARGLSEDALTVTWLISRADRSAPAQRAAGGVAKRLRKMGHDVRFKSVRQSIGDCDVRIAVDVDDTQNGGRAYRSLSLLTVPPKPLGTAHTMGANGSIALVQHMDGVAITLFESCMHSRHHASEGAPVEVGAVRSYQAEVYAALAEAIVRAV